jgi:hypothetical protein
LFIHEVDYLTLARVLISQEKLHEAASLVSWIGEHAQSGGRSGRLIAALNLQAIAQETLGRRSEAIHTMETSLGLGEPQGFMRIS